MLSYFGILLDFLSSTYPNLKSFNSYISIFIACVFLHWTIDSMRTFLVYISIPRTWDSTCHMADGQ